MNEKEVVDLLVEIKNTMYKWANESRTGGWSTHQVEPQLELASKIDEFLYRMIYK